jgi:hypothetical protein
VRRIVAHDGGYDGVGRLSPYADIHALTRGEMRLREIARKPGGAARRPVPARTGKTRSLGEGREKLRHVAKILVGLLTGDFP